MHSLQVAEDGRFMKESDIWSFGTILYLMWGTGHNPHETLETAYNEVGQLFYVCLLNNHTVLSIDAVLG